uniref:coiled-coil domain-containing protein 17-like n=1 Tax=Centroberyx gerrardi TaxID=166262 RepID=UPI003AAEB8B1
MELSCGDCSMVFHSIGLLEKHKARFCIGSDIGHPGVPRQSSEHIIRDNGGGFHPKQTRTPDLVQLRGQQIHQQQRNIRWRDVDAEPKPGRAEDQPVASQTESVALQTLTDEFHKLRMSIEESLPNWTKWTTDTEVCDRQLGRSEKLKEMREMAELHERQLAQIHAHNQHLELQREELARQLGVLSEQSSTSHLESLLTELREQEERNEETLQQLSEHLRALHVKEISVPADQPDPGEKREMHHATFDLMSSVAGPLSTQIKALRLAYMQSGGSDPAVVAQMIDLQAEAQTLEQHQPGAGAKARRKKVKPPQRGQSWELLAVEQENQRLEEEILKIQLARERHCGHEAAVRSELQLIQRESLHHMASLQAEMESLGREMERTREAPRHRREPPPPPPPLPFPPQPALHPLAHIHAPLALARSCLSPLGRHVVDPLDSLGPAPYDPAAGFVIFYDLVLGVDATLKALRLVAALFLGGQEVGRPTPLPPVHCQLGWALPYAHSLSLSPGNYAPLSVKQPVPRMQPSPSLSLVVEVQAAGGLDVYGQEVHKLVSRGWARLELFDQYNQLHSGHWRVPVCSLPVRPSLSPGQLNSVPQVGNMELCVRLVNGRDADVQTLAKPDPSTTSHYKHPAVGNPALPISRPQPTGANQLLSLLPFTDHQDPPPMEETNQS